MINFKLKYLPLITLLGSAVTACESMQWPLSQEANQVVKHGKAVASEQEAPLFEKTLMKTKASVDEQLNRPINVPQPKDAGGGYTHEQHKRNFRAIYNAGLLYQLTDEKKYAAHAKNLLLAYAEMYPTLGEHPEKKEQSPGRLFWQSLNEAMFLVHAIQGYDAARETFSAEERTKIEDDFFRNIAEFLSEDQPQTFNKVHNHGTWATAGVGMTGYVLGDDELVEKALLGLDKSGKGGFLKQLDVLFSPDGYYSEGPYYQRFALLPFVVFAQKIQKNDPERKIFEYRDGIIPKAIDTTVHLSYNGLFFPINDALKEKGLDTAELTFGLAAAYELTQDPTYLSIAEYQDTVILSETGREMAQAIEQGKSQPFPFKSMNLKDGTDGMQGALAILRSGHELKHQAVVVKNTSQGLGHGHFDKMAILFYDNGSEIVFDYGAARFLNVVDKNGGHYLRENTTWAKQTIAHNTLVVDETSHFNGKLKEAEKYNPEVLFFDTKDNVSIIRAVTKNAYPGTIFDRTVAQIKLPQLTQPVVIDLVRVNSKKAHQYDMPIHYDGHITKVSFPYKPKLTARKPLGEKNGYQHLWHTASGMVEKGLNQVTWLKDDRFYTYSFLASNKEEVAFAQLGANDPDFNLRDETSFIRRQKGQKDSVFVSMLEPHGDYNPSVEYTLGSSSRVKNMTYKKDQGIDEIHVMLQDGSSFVLLISDDPQKEKKTLINGQSVMWQGNYKLITQNN